MDIVLLREYCMSVQHIFNLNSLLSLQNIWMQIKITFTRPRGDYIWKMLAIISFRLFLSPQLISSNQETIILPLVPYGSETWCLILKEIMKWKCLRRAYSEEEEQNNMRNIV
jgi:hypothetical protein